MTIENKNFNSLDEITKAKIDGIQFNNINAEEGKRFSLLSTRSGNVWRNSSVWTPVINAVDIDWNSAVLPHASTTNGGEAVIDSTGQLLDLIDKMQDEIYVLTAAVIALSQG